VTTHADSPSVTAYVSGPRLLVVVLLAVLSLGGSGLSSAAASSSEPFQAVTAAADDATLTGTASATNRQRSVIRRRARQRLTLHVVVTGNQRGTTVRRWLLRCVALMAPMWRGPPILRL
jgi:hypothetical protein